MKVASPAKINLFLHVTGRRKNGYHDLETVMACVDLCDDIYFDFQASDISVTCSHPRVPEDETNLAHRAATIFWKELARKRGVGRVPGGVAVAIDKQIPVGGGLGGGSSNAATVLKSLNHWFDKPFSRRDLMDMGLCLGADVPFFVQGGAALARGVGELLTPCTLKTPCRVLLASPGVAASTALVYKNINLALTTGHKSTNNALIIACEENRVLDISVDMHNDLEASACELYPEIQAFKTEMAGLLTQKVMMTGSGASFFVLFWEDGQAECAFDMLSRRWHNNPHKRIFLTSFI
ncbi:4-diphosphocytidyl-2-C-methyl-D-erythritol kinase [Desulfocicer vacuolatum DSM 3385]|uniref:4-diphosphocytidyl-2-C-methyl-D-erythritol kinase n=1 Tax=Desulfocicer vacuolatum DSM 3385 TaxID=1121400 RepID=A0A1W1YK18_9BACT|nr:4-(cytidine 5'-diphospho)-2-C-methyl-D-erythritol kinase [Desulfocicer vacuolatum]SMC36527.1 4-diphosphocytidyl-2-C-methyl-D-erythritol kinase [Desulfocicer vacuolatum DSM 3385]